LTFINKYGNIYIVGNERDILERHPGAKPLINKDLIVLLRVDRERVRPYPKCLRQIDDKGVFFYVVFFVVFLSCFKQARHVTSDLTEVHTPVIRITCLHSNAGK